MLLNEKAVLVSPVLKKWNPRKVDHALRDSVASSYGVQSKVLSTSKKLVALNEAVFGRIESVDKKIRNSVFYSVGQGCTGFCVPYDYKGKHLLPTELEKAFLDRFTELKDERERLVKQVVDSWETIIESAQEELKGLFDANDYPSKEEIASRYECRVIRETLPDSAWVGQDEVEDPRYGVSSSDVAEVESRTKSTIELSTEEATRNVSVLLTHLTDCLKNDKTFRDSSFDKVKQAVESFGAWNFNNNPDLVDASAILVDAVSKISGADDLRKDTAKADDFVEEVDKASEILNNLDGVI
jgi:hypothetical protein